MSTLNNTFKDISNTEAQDELVHDEQIDFSKANKRELLVVLHNINYSENPSKVLLSLKHIRNQYEIIQDSEKAIAIEKFIADGGDIKDFELKKDEDAVKFEKLFEQVKSKLQSAAVQQEKERENNLVAKKHILEMLRELISKEETNESIISLKDYQDQWKKIGAVPSSAHQELYQSYTALIDRFYNNRSIYFELKELDRKKNYEHKIELCEKAEKLLHHPDVSTAVRELKTLHDEYKIIGPVPKEQQEELWQRFKDISDQLYQKRTEHLQQIRNRQIEALAKKEEIIARAEAFKDFKSDRIDDWKAKTSELNSIQEEWKSIGNVPSEASKEVNKRFWAACKAYFTSKEAFFEVLEDKRKKNLETKIALCEKAELIAKGEDSVQATNEIKDLQRQWDKIGGVPQKQKELINNRFKTACDGYFQRKRDLVAAQEKEYELNYQSKIEICSTIIEKSKAGALSEAELREMQEKFKGIGFVPKEKLKEIQEKYQEAVQSFIKQMGAEAGSESHANLKLSLEISALKQGPDAEKKVQKKEQEVARKISALKSDIAQYSNNMEFFGRSANAEKLKQDIQKKIDATNIEIKNLEQQLKLIKQA